LAKEAKTTQVAYWLESQGGERLLVSDWVITEFSSALSIKRRTGQIGDPGRAAALAEFKRLTEISFSVLPVERAQFHAAAAFADQPALGLRGGDALHLAIAAHHGATLCTLDRRLSEAGSALGVKTLLL
jgi:predicted nucleic acid-binding protein